MSDRTRRYVGTMMDRDESDNQLLRWRAADEARDHLQTELDDLDRPEALLAYSSRGEIDGERERLGEAITVADDEIMDAEIAFHRALGDHEQVAEQEVAQVERAAILADAFGDRKSTKPPCRHATERPATRSRSPALDCQLR